MPTPTYAAIADSILTAILDLATGKISSWSAFGQSYTYHDLKTLQDMETDYRAKANADSGYGITVADLRDLNR